MPVAAAQSAPRDAIQRGQAAPVAPREPGGAYLGFTCPVAGVLAGCKRDRWGAERFPALPASPNSPSLEKSCPREVLCLGYRGQQREGRTDVVPTSPAAHGRWGPQGAVTDTPAFPGLQVAESGPWRRRAVNLGSRKQQRWPAHDGMSPKNQDRCLGIREKLEHRQRRVAAFLQATRRAA